MRKEDTSARLGNVSGMRAAEGAVFGGSIGIILGAILGAISVIGVGDKTSNLDGAIVGMILLGSASSVIGAIVRTVGAAIRARKTK